MSSFLSMATPPYQPIGFEMPMLKSHQDGGYNTFSVFLPMFTHPLNRLKVVLFLHQVNLSGAFVSALRRDLETTARVEPVDPSCIITESSEVATLDLATLSPDELVTNGVKARSRLHVSAHTTSNN